MNNDSFAQAILLVGTVAQMSDVTHGPLVSTASSQARLTPVLFSDMTNELIIYIKYYDDYK